MKSTTQHNEDMKEHLDAIRRAGRRLNRTIQGILDFSKMEARAFELRPQAVKLGTVLERHVEDIRILAEQKNLRLRCVIDEPKGTVLFDEYCLSGALTNLLQNAIKFTEQGSVTARLYRDSDRQLENFHHRHRYRHRLRISRANIRAVFAGGDPAIRAASRAMGSASR